MAQLTEAQWRWVEEHNASVNKGWFKMTAWVLTVHLIIGYIFYSLFVVDIQWMRNITIFLTIFYLLWLILCNAVVWGLGLLVTAARNKKWDDVEMRKVFSSVKTLTPLLHRRNTLMGYIRTVRKVYFLFIEYAAIIALIAYGWIVWGTILLFLNALSDFGGAVAKHMTTDFFSKLSPAKLQALSGIVDSNIAKEVIKVLNGQATVGDISTEVTDSGTETKIDLPYAPQSELILVVTQSHLKLCEEHYGTRVEHQSVDFAHPNSIETIESELVALARRREREATQ